MKPSDVHSTDAIAHGVFPPHGRLDLRVVDGAVVFADAHGPFNVEFVQAMARTLRELHADPKLPRPYADVVQFHGSLMGSKEMLDQLSATLKQVGAREIAVALALVVTPEVEGREFMLPLFERVFVENGRNVRSFGNVPEAEAWVRACLKDAAGV